MTYVVTITWTCTRNFAGSIIRHSSSTGIYDNYLSIAVLAALDTLFGGIRAHLQQVYDDKVFISGFFFNIALAAALAFLGVHLGVDLYLAAIFAFGVRLFQNIAVIRRILLVKWTERGKVTNTNAH